jgi:hypothetical protein
VSGETADRASGWTVDTLHEHLAALLKAAQDANRQRVDDLIDTVDERDKTQRREVQSALASAEKAVIKAEKDAKQRFKSVNEFRDQLRDQAATFMPRLEAEQRIDGNTRVIAELDRRFTDEIHNLASRLDLKQGIDSGAAVQKADTAGQASDRRQANTVLINGLQLLVAVLAVALTLAVYIAAHK